MGKNKNNLYQTGSMLCLSLIIIIVSPQTNTSFLVFIILQNLKTVVSSTCKKQKLFLKKDTDLKPKFPLKASK